MEGDNENHDRLFSCTYRPITGRYSLSCFITSSRRLCCNFWFGSRSADASIQDVTFVGSVPPALSRTRQRCRFVVVLLFLRNCSRTGTPPVMPRQQSSDKNIAVDIPVFCRILIPDSNSGLCADARSRPRKHGRLVVTIFRPALQDDGIKLKLPTKRIAHLSMWFNQILCEKQNMIIYRCS